MYKEVSKIPGGLARYEDEITTDYIENFVTVLMGRNIKENEFSEHVLSKFTSDICKEFGMI